MALIFFNASRTSSARLLVLLAVLTATGWAQEMSAPVIPSPGQNHVPPNTRAIEGTILDLKGSPVPGAVILLKDQKTLQVRSYIAQPDGKYRFFGLSTDVNYQIRAEQGDMTSPTKLVSVYDSHKRVKVDLKLKVKKKPYPH